jgi:hypothetical protein
MPYGWRPSHWRVPSHDIAFLPMLSPVGGQRFRASDHIGILPEPHSEEHRASSFALPVRATGWGGQTSYFFPLKLATDAAPAVVSRE